jgi:hypothetical protein
MIAWVPPGPFGPPAAPASVITARQAEAVGAEVRCVVRELRARGARDDLVRRAVVQIWGESLDELTHECQWRYGEALFMIAVRALNEVLAGPKKPG